MAQGMSDRDEAASIHARLMQLAAEKAALEARLAGIEAAGPGIQDNEWPKEPVTNRSPTREKIALFRSLFRGREDVFPKRWENVRTGKAGYAPACSNEWKPVTCGKPRVKCGACPNQAFLPVTNEVIERHLRGHHMIGVYPMLSDGACWFLAIDFDKRTWQRDVKAFLVTCRSREVPADMCGYSSLNQSRLRSPVASAPIS